MLRQLTLAVSFAWAAVCLIGACSSFSASSSPGETPDAAPSEDAEAGMTSDGGPVDPCLARDPLAEVAGLYLAGGFAPDGTEPSEVLRTPIHCDGTLGSWAVVGTLPRSAVIPIVAVLGDTMLFVGGQHSTGGSPFADGFDSAKFDPQGRLPAFLRRPATTDQSHVWRAQFASNGSTLVVAGGEGERDGGNGPLTTVTKWRMEGSGVATPSAGEPLPRPISRGGAAMIGDTLFVFARGAAPDGDAGSTNGAIYRLRSAPVSTWENLGAFEDFDFTTAASATAIPSRAPSTPPA